MALKMCLLVSLFIVATAAHSAASADPETIRYSGSQYYPPLESLNNNGEAQGYITDLARAMAASTGNEAQFHLQRWHAAQQAIQNGELDAIALIASDQRSEFYDFTVPFYYVAHGIFSHRSGEQFGSIEQLANRRVAFVRDSFAYGEIDSLNISLEVVVAEHELECLQLVANQTADACIEVLITSNHLARIHRLPVEVTSPPFWPQAYVFAVKKGNHALLELLNQQLANIVVDGSYLAVYQKWANEIETKPHSTWEHLEYVLWLFISVCFVAVVFILWSWALRKKVHARTAALSQELAKSKELQAELTYTSAHDSVTGLFNRDAFVSVLEKQLPSVAQQPIKVVVVQIANIDRIAITLGHQASLDTISAFAKTLAAIPNTLVAHFDNGLFAMIYSGTEPFSSTTERLIEQQLDDANGIEPLLAFGVAHHQKASESITAAELLRRAMTALAHARKKHLLVGYYEPSIEPNSSNLRLLSDYLRVRCSQFVLHYQPQLCLDSQEITHVEALIRWQHPELGLLSPLQFIPIFEESGVISKVTQWVIKESIAMLKRHDNNLMVSVNITTRDLVDDSFLPYLKEQTQNIDPSRLVLEVTETGIFEDSGQAQNCIKAIQQLGIKVAVDDYGTGYSSLSYLNDLAIQEIKIDRTFVAVLLKNPRAQAIVRSTVILAKELELEVVAEGVEDLETLSLLQRFGVDRIQGYYLAKPLPENELNLVYSSDR